MGIIDSGKDLLKLAEAYRNTELYQKVVDLQGQIVELSGERVTLQEKLQKANGRIKELENAATFAKKLTLKNEMYWAEGDPQPFCMKCSENSGKRIHLTKGSMRGYFCVVCNYSFGDDNYAWREEKPYQDPDREVI